MSNDNDYESGFDDPMMGNLGAPGDASPFDEAGPAGDETVQGLELPKFRRPKVDLYSVLLILSLVFIIVATAIHYFETTAYEYGAPPYKESSSPLPRPVAK